MIVMVMVTICIDLDVGTLNKSSFINLNIIGNLTQQNTLMIEHGTSFTMLTS